MIASTSPEKRRLSDPQRFTKSRKLILDHNQNSTRDKSLPIIPQLSLTLQEGLFSSLLSLDLSNTKLQSLPECVFLLNNLEHLRIERNEFSSLPNEICKLQSLKSINASENKIQGLPDNFGNLKHLEIVNLSFNKLRHLPTSCLALNHLKELFISNNRFKSLPECIEEGMKNLQVLDTSYNPLKFIAPPLSTKLAQFSAKGLKNCRFFPGWLLNPKFWNLKEIILDDSVFVKFSFQNNSDSHLRSLSMLNCSLNDSNLERITLNMVGLEKLRVGNEDHIYSRQFNTFCFLPGLNLKNPKAVNEMNVRATALSVLPHSINLFYNLEILDLGGNNITWLPDEICELKDLKVLIIDRNDLYSLPKEFGNLKKLEELVAYHNKLSRLPESMENLENLEIIDLYDNEFFEMPTKLGKQTLQCLDLERNFFVMSNLLMRNTSYDILRGRLRQHYNHTRAIGPKLNHDREDDDFKPHNYSESKEVLIEETETCASEKWSLPEENWNLSEDSADEYEPSREAKSKVPPARSLHQLHLSYGSYFCPAESHSQKVRHMVRRMMKKGLRKQLTHSIEEGQFDDV